MSSEKRLRKFFDKLSQVDFSHDRFLKAFYKAFEKEKGQDLFQCYVEYLIRNKEFADDNDKVAELRKLFDDIWDHAINFDSKSEAKTGFITDAERQQSIEKAGTPQGIDPATTKSTTKQSTTKSSTTKKSTVKSAATSSSTTDQKVVIKLNKKRVLEALSLFIKQSGIVVNEEPDADVTIEDQKFRESTTDNIIFELERDGIKLPEAKKDPELKKRSDMMNIWRHTEKKCQELIENQQLLKIVSKIFFIDTSTVTRGIATIATVHSNETIERLPVENIKSMYTNGKYDTIIKLTNTYPIQEALALTVSKQKPIYICTGHQMISGGNADQGIDCTESMLYMTSSYSVALENAIHAYPMRKNQALLCPKVLVFKDTNYNLMPVSEWNSIAVLNAPAKFRPKLNISDASYNTGEADARLFEPNTQFATQAEITMCIENIRGALETALFFGYDTVVLDDHSIADCYSPAHHVAKILKETLNKFSGRFKRVVIAVNKSRSFNVFRYYFSV